MPSNDTPATKVAKDENDAVHMSDADAREWEERLRIARARLAGSEDKEVDELSDEEIDEDCQEASNLCAAAMELMMRAGYNDGLEAAAVLCERDFDRHFTRELAGMIRALKMKETK